MISIKNNHLQIEVNKMGAELSSIKRLSDHKNYMWKADPQFWTGYAPVLFPIVGALKNQTYYYKAKAYELPQHGFLRKNNKVKLIDQTKSSLTFSLKADQESLKIYPFQFEIQVTFQLENNTLSVQHNVINYGNDEMYFSLGAHPAFKCPMIDSENYNDHYLEFEKNEMAHTWKIEANSGLIGEMGNLIMNGSNTIHVHENIFDEGALIFKHLHSSRVNLCSQKSGKHVSVSFEGFPYLGIWAKPKAPFVCIEPWLGIADSINTYQQLTEKEGVLKLSPGQSFKAAYHIECF